jgi:predicted RNA-binding Zn-ribbon protein involved in translation (DUF1610 family)
MNKLECLKCGHEWLPRQDIKPLACPRCHSVQWDSEGYQPCQVCKRNFLSLNIHHINGNHQDNKISNLIKICVDCHTRIHYRETTVKGNGAHRRNRNYQMVNPEVTKKLDNLRKIWLKTQNHKLEGFGSNLKGKKQTKEHIKNWRKSRWKKD